MSLFRWAWRSGRGRLLIIVLAGALVGSGLAWGADVYAGRSQAQGDAARAIEAYAAQARASENAQRIARDRVDTLRLQVESLDSDLRLATIHNADLIARFDALVGPGYSASPAVVAAPRSQPAPAFTPAVGPVPQQPSPAQPPVLCNVIDLLRLCERGPM